MSQENVEMLVRSVMAAWERGDYDSAEWADPEIEAVIADGPSPSSSTGLPGMAASWGDFLHAWEGFHHKVEGYRELDDERVLVLVQWAGRGKTSGLEVDQMTTRSAVLFHVRGGKVMRVVAYLDRERALADLGLSE
jgi:ketosteroid isomerase-like protein